MSWVVVDRTRLAVVEVGSACSEAASGLGKLPGADGSKASNAGAVAECALDSEAPNLDEPGTDTALVERRERADEESAYSPESS